MTVTASHGWSSTSSAPNLNSGCVCNMFEINCLAESDISSQNGDLKSYWPLKIRSNNSSCLFSGEANGGKPQSKIYNITPAAHTSIWNSINSFYLSYLFKDIFCFRFF